MINNHTCSLESLQIKELEIQGTFLSHVLPYRFYLAENDVALKLIKMQLGYFSLPENIITTNDKSKHEAELRVGDYIGCYIDTWKDITIYNFYTWDYVQGVLKQNFSSNQ